jgi:hypothetical protein
MLNDLKFGIRMLAKNPAFTAVAVLSLALGIGANTAIFQLLNAVRLKTLPLRNPQELAQVRLRDSDIGRDAWQQGNNALLTADQSIVGTDSRSSGGILRHCCVEYGCHSNLAQGGEIEASSLVFG